MNLDHLLKQLCTISTAGAQDKFGKKTQGTAVEYDCRFQKTSRVIATTQREREPINGVVWLSATAVVARDDKLTFDSVDYRVMTIEPMIDRNGATRHIELMVQEWNL